MDTGGNGVRTATLRDWNDFLKAGLQRACEAAGEDAYSCAAEDVGGIVEIEIEAGKSDEGRKGKGADSCRFTGVKQDSCCREGGACVGGGEREALGGRRGQQGKGV